MSTREMVRRVAKLPEEFMVRRVAGHWIVAGPTGVFVVGRAGRDLADSAQRTAALAHRLRSLLSDTMPWVPFVDALVIGKGTDHTLECAVVEPEMLEAVLTSGANTLDPDGLHQIKLQLPRLAQLLQPYSAPRPATA